MVLGRRRSHQSVEREVVCVLALGERPADYQTGLGLYGHQALDDVSTGWCWNVPGKVL